MFALFLSVVPWPVRRAQLTFMTKYELDVVLTKLNLPPSPCQIMSTQCCIFMFYVLANVNHKTFLCPVGKEQNLSFTYNVRFFLLEYILMPVPGFLAGWL